MKLGAHVIERQDNIPLRFPDSYPMMRIAAHLNRAAMMLDIVYRNTPCALGPGSERHRASGSCPWERPFAGDSLAWDRSQKSGSLGIALLTDFPRRISGLLARKVSANVAQSPVRSPGPSHRPDQCERAGHPSWPRGAPVRGIAQSATRGLRRGVLAACCQAAYRAPDRPRPRSCGGRDCRSGR